MREGEEVRGHLRRLRDAFLSPPYPALPWAVFCYVLVSCLLYTANGPFTGHILGFDDHTRMVEVLQWVNGGGWYDRLISRVNAPEGFETIWARAVDIPIAFVIVVAQLFVDQRIAALVASVVVPLTELALLFMAARYFARPIAGRKDARLVLLFVMFTTALNHANYTFDGFHIGEASHHAWYGILNVVMFGAAVRVVLGVPGLAPRLMLGLAVALSLAVGIEGFPIIAGVFALIAVLAWGFQHEHLARRGAETGAIATFSSLLLLPLHRPPDLFFSVSVSQPSILGPILLACAVAFLFLQIYVLRLSRDRRVTAIMLILIAALFGYLLSQIFPQLLDGSLAALSPAERNLARNVHPEIWSMYHVAGDIGTYLGYAMPTFIALAFGYHAMGTTGNPRRRRMFAAYAGFTALTGGLAERYWRYIHYAQTAACPLLLWGWQRLRLGLTKNSFYRPALLLGFLAMGPFWMLLLPAITSHAPIVPYALFFPGKLYAYADACDVLSLARYLDQHYSKDVSIEVPDIDSSYFLYETHLKVDFLANFPSHDKFVDNVQFFQAQDFAAAEAIAKRHQFDLVALCPAFLISPPMAMSRPYRAPTLIEALNEGQPPPWLKKIPLDFKTNYMLFEVDKTALSKDDKIF